MSFNGNSPVTVSYNTIGAPSITGTNASGTWNININGNATNATNLLGGAAGALPYQISANNTRFINIGSSGQVLTVVSGVPAWQTIGSGSTLTLTNNTNNNQYALCFFNYATGGQTAYIDGSANNIWYNPSSTTFYAKNIGQ